ncbi:hypothetical protein N7470_002170 [Penicillium chermesinum]|nr:hypothetical protein N7470_002170 [Penicillium chermesinum]
MAKASVMNVRCASILGYALDPPTKNLKKTPRTVKAKGRCVAAIVTHTLHSTLSQIEELSSQVRHHDQILHEQDDRQVKEPPRKAA